MSDHNEQLDPLESARAAMRSRLGQEFRSLHRRRRQRRVAVAFLVPLALFAALIAWNRSSRLPKQIPAPPLEQLAVNPTPSAATEKTTIEAPPSLVESNHNTGPTQASQYQAIEFIQLKPDDLPNWLAEAKSDLIVYKVNGRTEVVSERELLEASTKQRKQRMN